MENYEIDFTKIITMLAVIAGIIILGFQILAYREEARAQDPWVPVQMQTTAYTAGVGGTGTITASGTTVRAGICAVNAERLGQTAIVYADNDGVLGEILGIYECLDIGYGKKESNGKGSIENGNCIDIYFNSLDEVQGWMALTGGKVWVQFVWCEG